jgi:hypothetical protein
VDFAYLAANHYEKIAYPDHSFVTVCYPGRIHGSDVDNQQNCYCERIEYRDRIRALAGFGMVRDRSIGYGNGNVGRYGDYLNGNLLG